MEADLSQPSEMKIVGCLGLDVAGPGFAMAVGAHPEQDCLAVQDIDEITNHVGGFRRLDGTIGDLIPVPGLHISRTGH
jgi:hypothetical protein